MYTLNWASLNGISRLMRSSLSFPLSFISQSLFGGLNETCALKMLGLEKPVQSRPKFSHNSQEHFQRGDQETGAATGNKGTLEAAQMHWRLTRHLPHAWYVVTVLWWWPHPVRLLSSCALPALLTPTHSGPDNDCGALFPWMWCPKCKHQMWPYVYLFCVHLIISTLVQDLKSVSTLLLLPFLEFSTGEQAVACSYIFGGYIFSTMPGWSQRCSHRAKFIVMQFYLCFQLIGTTSWW